MKNALTVFFATLLMASPAFAFSIQVNGGTTDCDTSTFTAFGTTTTSAATGQQLFGCNANGSPMFIMEPWGLTVGDSQSLIVKAGTPITDEAGYTYLDACPKFMQMFGCFNLVSLNYYKMQMRTIAQQTGLAQYAYWLTH